MKIYMCLLLLFFCVFSVSAHKTETRVFYDGMVGIKASFGSGEPMAHCKALIFAPGSTDVTLTATTDSNGIVCFAPDKAGVWIVQIRAEDGHGARVDITVDESLRINPDTSLTAAALSPLQTAVMIICVVWALLATGILISKRGKK